MGGWKREKSQVAKRKRRRSRKGTMTMRSAPLLDLVMTFQ